jgi:hypothetical protein
MPTNITLTQKLVQSLQARGIQPEAVGTMPPPAALRQLSTQVGLPTPSFVRQRDC